MSNSNKKTEGIEKRIRAAKTLWANGDKEDAAALVFIATAAISRLRFPQMAGYSDRAAFTGFISEQVATITNGASPNPLRFPQTTKLPGVKETQNVPLEDVFYGAWRCVLIHEAMWPDEVYLTETRVDSDYTTHIELPPDGRLGLPEQWILGLAFAVEKSVEIVLPQIFQFPSYVIFSGNVDSLESNQYQVRPGETKVPRLKVRNQQAIPIFTRESLMKKFIKQNYIPEPFIGGLHDLVSLRNFVAYSLKDDRFIFNPEIGKKPLPSYSRDSLLGALPTP
jgi:hypothetical protein